MLMLEIPHALRTEFATINALWQSGAKTRRVDSLILSWVKYEKQLRRLFCFLVFQHPDISEHRVERVLSDLAENDRLFPRTFIRAIGELRTKTVAELIGEQHSTLNQHVQRIQNYRNKLVHGQVTGQKIDASALERDVRWIISWVESLAAGAQTAFGYDGLGRDTFKTAKATKPVLTDFPFTPETFGEWLHELSHPKGRAR